MNNESTIQNLNATNLWCISPQDRLFLGEALIETLAVRGGTAQHSLLHWQRLQRSAVLLGYSSCPNFEVWQLALQRQIHQDNLINGGVKVVLTGGIAARGLSQQGEGNQLLVQTFTYEQGIKPLRLMKASWQRDANNPLYQIKAMSYLEGIFAQRQAHHAAVDDVLFFNQNGYATETSCANLFVIYRNRILTPPVTDGVVSGIIRTILLTQSQDIGLTFIEESITIETLEHAEAVFVTNSLQGVRCVETLDDMSWSTAHPLIKKIQTLLL